jgi:hypothetical protein
MNWHIRQETIVYYDDSAKQTYIFMLPYDSNTSGSGLIQYIENITFSCLHHFELKVIFEAGLQNQTGFKQLQIWFLGRITVNEKRKQINFCTTLVTLSWTFGLSVILKHLSQFLCRLAKPNQTRDSKNYGSSQNLNQQRLSNREWKEKENDLKCTSTLVYHVSECR